MNKRIAFKLVTTYARTSTQTLDFATRVKHARTARHYEIDCHKVSKRWLDLFDILMSDKSILYAHHHQWGMVVCQVIWS